MHIGFSRFRERETNLFACWPALIMLIASTGAGAADPKAGERSAQTCAACHGANGNSASPLMPSLAGQPPLYTVAQLIEFRAGQRDAPQMTAIAASLSDAEIENLAAYFAAQPLASSRSEPDSAKFGAGKKLAQTHHCGSCHLPNYAGQNHIARLAGQREDYLLKAMQDYRDGRRAGFDGTMTGVLRGLSDADLSALAHYLAHLRE
jgi:cytochrome c553